MVSIKKYIKKNASPLTVLVIILFVGVVFVIFTGNQINSQKAQILSLQKNIKTNNDQIAKLSSENASKSAQIQTLLNQPKPTPEIKYVTQYKTITEPAPDTSNTTTNCYPDGIGGQYCNSSNGTHTNCYPNGIGGYYCH